MAQTNKWFCKKSCSTKHGKKHKAVIQCLFLWQQLFCSLYYLTQHDHTTRCSDFWKNKTVQPWAKRNQSDSKLHKLQRKWLVQLGCLLLNELLIICSMTLINPTEFLMPTGSSGLLVEAGRAGVEAAGFQSMLVDSAELLVSRTVPW